MKHKSILNKRIIENNKEILSNLDFFSKTKFKGKQEIEIIKKFLNYEDANEVIESINMEIYDKKNDNNREVEFNLKNLLMLIKKISKKNEKYECF